MQPFSFENLPKDWKWTPIGEIAVAVRGVAFPGNETSKEKFENSIACLTTSGVQDEVKWSSRRFIPQKFLSHEEQILKDGDLLVSTANSKELVGKSCLIKKPNSRCTFGAFVTVLRPNTKVDSSLFAYWMRSKEVLQWSFQNSSNTTNISNLRTSELLALEVPLPKPEEQKRIARLLDNADRLHRQRRFAQTLSDSFLQSVFFKMFGDPANNPNEWVKHQVGKVLSKNRTGIRTGPFGSSLKRHEYVEEGIPVWGINNVNQNEFIEDNPLYITQEKFRELRNYVVQSGDILISRAGTVGRMCVATPNTSLSIIGTNLVLVALDFNQLSPLYFTALFTYFPSRVGNLRTTGDENAYSFLNPSNLREISIPLPPLPLQEKFAAIVQKFERVRRQQREAKRQAEHLFQTLLHRAFRGEL